MRLIPIILLVFALSDCMADNKEEAHATDHMAAQKLWVETCDKWDDWDKSGPAFLIHGTTYYVGSCGISAILITSSKGHILIDGGTEKGADIIRRNIASLGFDVSDVKILLHSHEHFDHVAGLAELQRLSGARLYASAAAKPVLETGQTGLSDPQYGMHAPFPAAIVDDVIDNRDTVQLGAIKLTAITTPGHTEGALSWQWKSCEGKTCEWIVYADSLSPISRDGYRFSDNVDYLKAYERSLEQLSQTDCTLLLTPHPSASQMRNRLETGQLSTPNTCVTYADAIKNRLKKRLEKEAIED